MRQTDRDGEKCQRMKKRSGQHAESGNEEERGERGWGGGGLGI